MNMSSRSNEMKRAFHNWLSLRQEILFFFFCFSWMFRILNGRRSRSDRQTKTTVFSLFLSFFHHLLIVIRQLLWRSFIIVIIWQFFFYTIRLNGVFLVRFGLPLGDTSECDRRRRHQHVVVDREQVRLSNWTFVSNKEIHSLTAEMNIFIFSPFQVCAHFDRTHRIEHFRWRSLRWHLKMRKYEKLIADNKSASRLISSILL